MKKQYLKPNLNSSNTYICFHCFHSFRRPKFSFSTNADMEKCKQVFCPICCKQGMGHQMICLVDKIRIPKIYKNKTKNKREWKNFKQWLSNTFPYYRDKF